MLYQNKTLKTLLNCELLTDIEKEHIRNGSEKGLEYLGRKSQKRFTPQEIIKAFESNEVEHLYKLAKLRNEGDKLYQKLQREYTAESAKNYMTYLSFNPEGNELFKENDIIERDDEFKECNYSREELMEIVSSSSIIPDKEKEDILSGGTDGIDYLRKEYQISFTPKEVEEAIEHNKKDSLYNEACKRKNGSLLYQLLQRDYLENLNSIKTYKR